MTATPPPSGSVTHTHPRPSGVVIVVIGLVIVVLIVVAGVLLSSLVHGNEQVDITVAAAAGERVSVAASNAEFTLRPSADGQVHLLAHGTYLGTKPTITATTSGGVTTIVGTCGNQGLFTRCSLDLTVTLPATLPLRVTGKNGSIAASGLTGPLTFETTNGAIKTSGSEGRLDLRSTNGAIRVLDARSGEATATTTNGTVELSFDAAPTRVEATSTNGAVTVRVPVDTATYFVSAHTTNGSINDSEVPSDRGSNRTITARTTNGNVTIVPR